MTHPPFQKKSAATGSLKNPVPWENLSITVPIGPAATAAVFVPAAKATVIAGPVANVFPSAAIMKNKYAPGFLPHPMSATDVQA